MLLLWLGGEPGERSLTKLQMNRVESSAIIVRQQDTHHVSAHERIHSYVQKSKAEIHQQRGRMKYSTSLIQYRVF